MRCPSLMKSMFGTVMNKYLKNLNRIEFVVTLACTGRCRHCSEGEHRNSGESIDKDAAVTALRRVAECYPIETIMTFGGEPLLCPETVFAIHSAAKELGIPKRQIITNGFFSKNQEKIRLVAKSLAKSGVNDIMLSVDAFHQETIPLEYVKIFAEAVKNTDIRIRTHPAWLVSPDADNHYNAKTREILAEFCNLGIEPSDGNVIFPSGNAIKYLGEYFDPENEIVNPYIEDEYDVRSLSFSENGDILCGNIYKQDISEIILSYDPYK